MAFIREIVFTVTLYLFLFSKFFPGCGPRLIQQGYSTYTSCNELTREKFVELFAQVASWPEYENSFFNGHLTFKGDTQVEKCGQIDWHWQLLLYSF